MASWNRMSWVTSLPLPDEDSAHCCSKKPAHFLQFKWNYLNASAPLLLEMCIFQLWLYLCGHSVGEGPQRGHVCTPRVRSLLVALGSHSLAGEQTAHCPAGQLFCLARTVIILHTGWLPAESNQVWITVFSPPRSLLTFTIIQCFFSTFFRGESANTLSDCSLYSIHTLHLHLLSCLNHC